LKKKEFVFHIEYLGHYADARGADASVSGPGGKTCSAILGGIVAPYVTGVIVDKTGQFSAGFCRAGIALVLGAAAYLVIVGRVEPIVWRVRPRVLS